MATEQTLSIIKPDAVEKGIMGHIIQHFLDNGIKIKAMKMVHLTRSQAEGFYYVHRDKRFFNGLVEFMTSGPCVLMILDGEDVIVRNRTLMGATDPAKADKGTIRERFGTNIERNAVHGSDSMENAKFEINYFFNVFERM